MKLSELDKSRVYFHLGCASKAGVPAGDLARYEEACNDIENDYMMGKIKEQLERCDRAWEATDGTSDSGGGRYTTKQLYSGDINRAILTESIKDKRLWWQEYLDECDRLAQMLWIPNYRQPESLRYRYARIGTEFINALPGVADTCAISRVEATRTFAGSFGF